MSTGGAAGYAAIHSRVRVMYSELISPQAEARLCEAADLTALIGMLKETPYGAYLAALEDKDLTSRGVTSQVKRRLAEAYQTLIYGAPASTRTLLIELFRHYEIDNLKAILRGILAGSDGARVNGILFPMGALGVLPVQDMLEAETIEEAVERLSSTPYYSGLSRAMKRYSEEGNLFPLEVALDLSYWRQLWGDAGRLGGRDQTQALRVLGLRMDLNNLMWAMRYRAYHHLSEEEIINYTLPFGHHVRDEDIRAIAAGADIARVLARLYPGLGRLDGWLEDPEQGLPKLELELQRYVREQLIGVFVGYPFQIGLLLAYLLLAELELQDLTVIIEAKASQMPPAEFMPYLLMNADLSQESLV